MRAYEDISGAQGRKIFYRAERFKARDLFGRIMPDLEVGNYALTFDDLSMSGLSAFADSKVNGALQVGHEMPVQIRTGNTVVYNGQARVCRVDTKPHGNRVAMHFISSCLDIGEVVAKHRRISLRHELEAELQPSETLVGEDYRRIAGDVVHLVRRYGAALNRCASHANGSAEAHELRMAEALAACEERIFPEWRSLWHSANEAVMPIMDDTERLRATKRFTELVITPEFLEGPIWGRSYTKPLGYPGDFEIMNQVYAWRREGETPLGRLLHRLGLDVAECIATRMIMIQHTIAETIATAADSGRAQSSPVRITSIGCGPAQEIYNYLQIKKLPHPAEFTLIDPEHQAVSCAYKRIYPEVVRFGPAAALQGLEMAFAQIIKAEDLTRKIPPQDLIYTVGLVDYLTFRRTRDLVARLYGQLAPGGLLIVGNMKDTPIGNLWPMEFICDWSVIYRKEAEMQSLAEGLGAASVELRPDPTGRVLMLYLRKP